jgi:hypothetical protein
VAGGHIGDVRIGALVDARAWLRAGDDHPPHQLRVPQRQRLRGMAADREAQYVDLPEFECADEGGGVIGEAFHRRRCLAAGRGDASVVEEDDGPVSG